MWLSYLLTSLAVLLVFEGLMPFLSPGRWRNTMRVLLDLNDRSLRIIGLLSMVLGTVLMYLVHAGVLY